MRIHQALALAKKESIESECTVHVCASFIFRKAEDGGTQFDATVDVHGYRTCDFWDSSVIGSFYNGKWRPA